MGRRFSTGLARGANRPTVADDLEELSPALSSRRRALRRLRRNPLALLGIAIVVFLIVLAVLGPLVAPHDPNLQFDSGLDDNGNPIAYSPQFLLGTDTLGRDMLSRIIYGARVSLTAGVLANGLAMAVGLLVGLVAGFRGGWLGALLMRLTDVMLAFPGLVFAMALVTAVGPSLTAIIIIIAATVWSSMARIIRGQVVSIKRRDFIEAARAMGVSDTGILWRHVLPQLTDVVLVYLTLNIAGTVLLESGLSYLGLGIQVPTSDWGAMITSGQAYFQSAPWLFFYPGIALMLTVLGFNLLGDGLRDALDPQGELR
jgi:ABC-type dipeptide/oligopeptide/nickel transport system permease subunit